MRSDPSSSSSSDEDEVQEHKREINNLLGKYETFIETFKKNPEFFMNKLRKHNPYPKTRKTDYQKYDQQVSYLETVIKDLESEEAFKKWRLKKKLAMNYFEEFNILFETYKSEFSPQVSSTPNPPVVVCCIDLVDENENSKIIEAKLKDWKLPMTLNEFLEQKETHARVQPSVQAQSTSKGFQDRHKKPQQPTSRHMTSSKGHESSSFHRSSHTTLDFGKIRKKSRSVSLEQMARGSKLNGNNLSAPYRRQSENPTVTSNVSLSSTAAISSSLQSKSRDEEILSPSRKSSTQHVSPTKRTIEKSLLKSPSSNTNLNPVENNNEEMNICNKKRKLTNDDDSNMNNEKVGEIVLTPTIQIKQESMEETETHDSTASTDPEDNDENISEVTPKRIKPEPEILEPSNPDASTDEDDDDDDPTESMNSSMVPRRVKPDPEELEPSNPNASTDDDDDDDEDCLGEVLEILNDSKNVADQYHNECLNGKRKISIQTIIMDYNENVRKGINNEADITKADEERKMEFTQKDLELKNLKFSKSVTDDDIKKHWPHIFVASPSNSPPSYYSNREDIDDVPCNSEYNEPTKNVIRV